MKASVIGIGLIGGSLAKSLKNYGLAEKIIGVDNNAAHLEQAKTLGLIDEFTLDIREAIQSTDLIILATPVDKMVKLLPEILDHVDTQVVMDVGSTKTTIMEIVKDHPKRGRFVGTHPMAGTEYSGPEAAIAGLFKNKCAVIVDKEGSDPDALAHIEDIFRTLEMQIVYHESHDHDIHTAYVSHISHISSFALALTVLEKEKNEKRIFELAGGGFSSTVRLAKSNPETWVPIFEQNRHYVLDVLDEHINTISRFRTLLIKRDFESFHKLIKQANEIQKIIH